MNAQRGEKKMNGIKVYSREIEKSGFVPALYQR